MNEYGCYGKGHTIHSSGQIEWFKNSVDDRSVQVGGKQRICTIDGYAMPLTCRGGLMYLSILGKPTDKDLERYPAVHLTGPHEWDPSVLDYTHPSGDGEPPWSNDPDERSTFDPNFDEFGDYTQRAIQTLSILDDSSSTLTPSPTLMAKILDHDTQKIIYRSAVKPKKSSTPNHRLAPHGGEVSASSDPSEDKISSGSPLGAPEGSAPKQKAPTIFIRSRDEENPSGSKPMPTFDPSDLIGRTFLRPPEENGERHRAKVTRQVVEIIDQDNGQRVENINFILDIGNGKVEELISYNQLLEHLENAQEHDMGMDQELYRFRAIIGHRGPLLASDPDWKGSKYNVQVEWETGEITFEPLSIIAADDPVTCAHMPRKMTYLLWRDGVDSEALPRRIRSLQEQ